MMMQFLVVVEEGKKSTMTMLEATVEADEDTAHDYPDTSKTNLKN
jgi:hypothetical protein